MKLSVAAAGFAFVVAAFSVLVCVGRGIGIVSNPYHAFWKTFFILHLIVNSAAVPPTREWHTESSSWYRPDMFNKVKGV